MIFNTSPPSLPLPPQTHIQRRNAFEIMKNAQWELSKKCMVDLVAEPHTRKHRLWNDIIKFLQEKNCKWKNAEVSTQGTSLVQALSYRYNVAYQWPPQCIQETGLLNSRNF